MDYRSENKMKRKSTINKKTKKTCVLWIKYTYLTQCSYTIPLRMLLIFPWSYRSASRISKFSGRSTMSLASESPARMDLFRQILIRNTNKWSALKYLFSKPMWGLVLGNFRLKATNVCTHCQAPLGLNNRS